MDYSHYLDTIYWIPCLLSYLNFGCTIISVLSESLFLQLAAEQAQQQKGNHNPSQLFAHNGTSFKYWDDFMIRLHHIFFRVWGQSIRIGLDLSPPDRNGFILSFKPLIVSRALNRQWWQPQRPHTETLLSLEAVVAASVPHQWIRRQLQKVASRCRFIVAVKNRAVGKKMI